MPIKYKRKKRPHRTRYRPKRITKDKRISLRNVVNIVQRFENRARTQRRRPKYRQPRTNPVNPLHTGLQSLSGLQLSQMMRGYLSPKEQVSQKEDLEKLRQRIHHNDNRIGKNQRELYNKVVSYLNERVGKRVEERKVSEDRPKTPTREEMAEPKSLVFKEDEDAVPPIEPRATPPVEPQRTTPLSQQDTPPQRATPPVELQRVTPLSQQDTPKIKKVGTRSSVKIQAKNYLVEYAKYRVGIDPKAFTKEQLLDKMVDEMKTKHAMAPEDVYGEIYAYTKGRKDIFNVGQSFKRAGITPMSAIPKTEGEYIEPEDEAEESLIRLRSGTKIRSGKGDSKGTTFEPLYSDQIDTMLKDYRHDGYLGCFASDEIKDIKKEVNKYDKIGFIMNLDPLSSPGSHWVAISIFFTNTLEVCYFDSLANPPTRHFLKQLKEVIMAREGLDYYLKLKINLVRRQRANSATCGLFSVGFIEDMIGLGKTFKEASGYDDLDLTQLKEDEIKKRFGYI
jgi:hypothetical protein